MKIFHFVPEDAKAVNRAINNGIPLVLDSPSAKVAKSVTKLAASVNGRHKAH
jgi:MinD-like ATPase involved in chromosome partitioning or flagellar assembly